jgi:hypothetical protein
MHREKVGGIGWGGRCRLAGTSHLSCTFARLDYELEGCRSVAYGFFS